MPQKINVWINEPKAMSKDIEFSAIVEVPNNPNKKLWYLLPLCFSDYVTETHDPYLLGTIFFAMIKGQNIHIHGKVSSSLLRNLEDFQQYWALWHPDLFKKVEVSVEKEIEEDQKSPPEAICAFSGGVDSCFTALRHSYKGIQYNRNLTTGLIIHGFEVPLEQEAIFQESFKRAKILLSSLKIDLVPMKTNIQEFTINWLYDYMGGLASCLSLLSKKFSTGLIGGSRANTTSTTIAFPWGSNAISDQLLSSHSFQIVNDGGFFTRTEKIAELAKYWPESNKYLQVCWLRNDKIGNCGKCAKCIVNILNYKANLFNPPECFPGNVTENEILNMKVQYITQIEDYIEILEQAYKNGLKKEKWVKALEFVLLNENSRKIQLDWQKYLLEKFKMTFIQQI